MVNEEEEPEDELEEADSFVAAALSSVHIRLQMCVTIACAEERYDVGDDCCDEDAEATCTTGSTTSLGRIGSRTSDAVPGVRFGLRFDAAAASSFAAFACKSRVAPCRFNGGGVLPADADAAVVVVEGVGVDEDDTSCADTSRIESMQAARATSTQSASSRRRECIG